MQRLGSFSLLLATALLGACATPSQGPSNRWSDRIVVLKEAMRLSQATSESLNAAQAALGADDVDRAQSALTDAKHDLADPNMQWSNDRAQLAERESRLEQQLAAVRASGPKSGTTNVHVSASESTPVAATPAEDPLESLQQAMAQMTKDRARLHGHELAAADVEAADRAYAALSQALEKGKAVAERDVNYASRATEAAKLLSDVEEDVRLGRLIAEFVDGPGASQKKGFALSQEARTEADSAKRHAAFKQAHAAFKDCEQGSLKMLSESPILNHTALFLSAERTSPKKVAAACAQQQKAIAKKIASR
jgi:hypothetical protein